MKTTTIVPAGLQLLRWLGRGLIVLVFLLWGAFFVEHVEAWLFHPWPATAPLRIWLAQGLHLVMLIGLALALWRCRLGAWVVAVSALLFFGAFAGARFGEFYLLTMAPVGLLVLAERQIHRRDNAAGAGAGAI